MNVREAVHPELCDHITIGYFIFQWIGDYYRGNRRGQEYPDGGTWIGAWRKGRQYPTERQGEEDRH